jgi:hypothetical protein
LGKYNFMNAKTLFGMDFVQMLDICSLPVLVGVDEIVRQVLLGGVLAHLDVGSSDYSWVVGARLRLQAEELPKQDPVGLDPHKGLVEMDEDGDMNNPVRVQVQVLDTVVLEETLDEVTRREGQPALHEPGEHRDLVMFFSIRYGSPAAARHMSISFSRRKPLFTSASKSSVFALDFFHSLFGFGRRGEVGGVDPWADPAASSRDLFFPAPVFMLFDGEDFILQMHRVFTRIHSGAFLEANSGGER